MEIIDKNNEDNLQITIHTKSAEQPPYNILNYSNTSTVASPVLPLLPLVADAHAAI